MEKKDAKFGSVEWQEEQRKKVLTKLSKGEKLDSLDKTFVEMQLLHNRKVIGETLRKVM